MLQQILHGTDGYSRGLFVNRIKSISSIDFVNRDKSCVRVPQEFNVRNIFSVRRLQRSWIEQFPFHCTKQASQMVEEVSSLLRSRSQAPMRHCVSWVI